MAAIGQGAQELLKLGWALDVAIDLPNVNGYLVDPAVSTTLSHDKWLTQRQRHSHPDWRKSIRQWSTARFQTWSKPAGVDEAYNRRNAQRSLGLGPPPHSASVYFPRGSYYHHQGHFQPSYAQEASAATPTPANRYAQRPTYRELKASVSGLDMSVSGLDNRVSAMEARLANPEHPTLSQDLAARRGGRFAQAKSHSTRRSTRSIPLDPALSTDDSIDADDTVLVPYTKDDSASESVELNEINLSKTERKLLKAIVRKVAMLADAELKDKHRWPPGLERKDTAEQPTWDPAYLFEAAKDVFRTAKRPWRASRKPEGRAKAAAGNTTDRRMQRSKLKSKQMEKVIDEYEAANNLTVNFLRDLIHPEFLSDEVSGPEEGAEESKDGWKVRMAVAANMSTNPAVLKCREFLEVLSLEWRTSKVLSIDRGYAPNRQYNRVSVGRASERIPRYAPFNFGISKAWVDVNKKDPELSLRLLDWGNFPESEDGGLACGEEDAREQQEN
ncbi:hypothetical protein K438DRAFT_1781134 [Mycena galopus ATCC 62051]|nr:hypothetical protein K438DRAFT_1781134 [Mycena galopus ATCC 62051]